MTESESDQAPSHGAPSARAQVRRIPARAAYDPAVIRAILREGIVCHVAVAVDGQPFVMPMAYGFDGEMLYLHGSPASRLMRQLAAGAPLSIAVTHVDGLVLARSAFHHSMNYRSVVILGRARPIEERGHKLRALDAIVEHIVPHRSADCRPPSEGELRGTTVVGVSLDEASAKVRSGPPLDDAEDYALPHYAGVIPLALVAGAPQPDPRLDRAIPIPEYVARYQRPGAG